MRADIEMQQLRRDVLTMSQHRITIHHHRASSMGFPSRSLNEGDADAEVLQKGERRYTGPTLSSFLHSILRHFRLILKSLTNPLGWVGPVLCESSVARKLLSSFTRIMLGGTYWTCLFGRDEMISSHLI